MVRRMKLFDAPEVSSTAGVTGTANWEEIENPLHHLLHKYNFRVA